MDSVDICAATSTTNPKRRAAKRRRAWHKQLHPRKTAIHPPTMQSEDQHGPKKIPEECKQSTTWPSSKKPPQEAQQQQQQQQQHRTSDSRNTLRFTCSQCKDNLDYVPKDLVRHFEESHRGIAPVFPCHMCTFNTHEFSYLQVHLLSHKDTFSSCSICNDNVKRTWPEFSAHLTLCHCQNGKYSCEKCQKFSTADVGVFLEHVCLYHFGLEGANEFDLLLHTKDSNQFGAITTTQFLRCQHCGYEASQKRLLVKHINANHVSQNGNQKKKGVNSIALKPNDPVPKMKPRLTRSAVREMCWLTDDCLSLPGREFLDKYCHLSDPQTTLEETKEFLMKSVGDSSDQKWTKALKTVLSNVPQDINLHSKPENGIMSNSADLTVLLKNKITLAQNGATYAKRLKMMASPANETLENTAGDAHRLLDHNGCESDLIDDSNRPLPEPKLNNDAQLSAQNDPPECTRMQENRENHELKTHLDNEKLAEPKNAHPFGGIATELMVINEGQEQTASKSLTKNKRRKGRRKRKSGYKKQVAGSAALALKIVLKKNPVKGKQWVSQSSLALSGAAPMNDEHGPNLPPANEDAAQVCSNPPSTEEQQKTASVASKPERHDATAALAHSKPAAELLRHVAATPGESDPVGASTPEDPQSQEEKGEEAEKSQTESDDRGRPCWTCAAEDDELRTFNNVPDCRTPPGDGVTLHCGDTVPAHQSKHALTPQGDTNSGDLSLGLTFEGRDQSDERIRGEEVPADHQTEILSSGDSPVGNAIHQEASPVFERHWQPVPKTLERTLKLVAINPRQLIKRPVRDQPVVVLNHPDADIPEVARIMEVVNRYGGEVQKVILSRRTLSALAASAGQPDRPADSPTPFAGHAENAVQERFILKLKLRRLSRKKYEVVGAVSPGLDAAKKFSCWFCGRAFSSQETWMVHRQRHLMEWKRPSCEIVAHTG